MSSVNESEVTLQVPNEKYMNLKQNITKILQVEQQCNTGRISYERKEAY